MEIELLAGIPFRIRSPAGRRFARAGASLALVGVLVACASHGSRHYAGRGGSYSAPSHPYPRPRPVDDPWGPYILVASRRFNVPDRWIREVMRRESGGQEQAVSQAGAI